jgi:hypothetical protein
MINLLLSIHSSIHHGMLWVLFQSSLFFHGTLWCESFTVGGVKMKKNWKKTHFAIRENIFFYCSFWLILWLCISKMICRAWEGAPISFQITQNGEELRKICQKSVGSEAGDPWWASLPYGIMWLGHSVFTSVAWLLGTRTDPGGYHGD